MFQRVRVRITILTVSLLLILYYVSSLAVYTIVEQNVMRGIDATLRNIARPVVEQGVNVTVFQLQLQLPPNAYAYVKTDTDIRPFNNPPDALNSEITQVIRTKRDGRLEYFNISADGQSYRVLYIPLPKTPYSSSPNFIVLVKNDEGELAVLNRLEQVLWVVGIFGLLGATLAGFYLAERVLRPIRKAWQRQLEFVANASHELRTPLAVIQSNLGIVMEHTDQSVLDNLEWLNNAHIESRRLNKLVQDLLTLARTDSEKAPIHMEPVDLTGLVSRVRDLYETITEMAGIDLRVESHELIQVKGDADRLHQLLVILLDNACKFTPEGGNITIRLGKSRNTAIMEVIDTGQGIDAADLPRVFERFYTGNESRSRAEKTGTGLGLSIAHWIVEAHHGKIAVQSKGLGHGTTVRIELPLLS